MKCAFPRNDIPGCGPVRWEEGFNPGIELIRLLAIASVFVAHFSPYPSADPLTTGPSWYLGLKAVAATFGVPVFFFISGYLSRGRRGVSFFRFIFSRRYLVPWFIWGAALYLVLNLTAGSRVSPVSGLNFIFNDSIYYFLTLLLFFEIAGWCLDRADWKMVFWISLPISLADGAWVFFLILRAPGGSAGISRLWTYLNPLMFFPMYALGRGLRQGLADRILRRPFLIFGLGLVAAAAKFYETWSTAAEGVWSIYFSPVSICYGLAVSLSLFLLFVAPGAGKIPRKAACWGRLVLPVYLVHLLFTGSFRIFFARFGIPLYPWHLAALPLIAAGSFGLAALGNRFLSPFWKRYLLGLP